MKKLITNLRKKFSTDTIYYEKAFIYSYIHEKNLFYSNDGLIHDFLLKDAEIYMPIAEFVLSNNNITCIDNLITVFEILIDGDEKKTKGIVYTPPVIRDYISETVIKTNYVPTVIDPACGCGAFLISAAMRIHQKYDIAYVEIFQKYIYGCDIDAHSILKAKLLFNIVTLQNEGKEINDFPNIFAANSLSKFSVKKFKHCFDVVVGNPPYVRAKNIEKKVKKSLNNWSVVSGNTDLYIPFYQLGIELLKPEGILGYISPNTYLQSVNGRELRNYIRDSKLTVSIINFKDTQNFPGVTHYTCITFIENTNIETTVRYAINDSNVISKSVFTEYNISSYGDKKEWRFGNGEIDGLVYRIEHQPHKLDEYGIKNGLATLCNDLYFFVPISEDDTYYYRSYMGKTYQIEKSICIDVAKPNIMRNEKDLIEKSEKAIYPYINGKIIPEASLERCYPATYAFLYANKKLLLSRDKGNISKYPTWYAYGRTQGMNNTGSKLLVPYMADRGVAILSLNENLLFYCGYAVFSEDIETLKILKVFIESDVFWFYIKMTSKPYSKGFMALAKNYIKGFGIPSLSVEQKKDLLSLQSDDREKYIAHLYDLDYDEIRHYLDKAS